MTYESTQGDPPTHPNVGGRPRALRGVSDAELTAAVTGRTIADAARALGTSAPTITSELRRRGIDRPAIDGPVADRPWLGRRPVTDRVDRRTTMRIRDRVLDWVESAGLNSSDLARLLGVSRQSVPCWPAARWAVIAGMTVEQLADLSVAMPAIPPRPILIEDIRRRVAGATQRTTCST